MRLKKKSCKGFLFLNICTDWIYIYTGVRQEKKRPICAGNKNAKKRFPLQK